MFFTMDEVALIDGLIATYFVAESVSARIVGTRSRDYAPRALPELFEWEHEGQTSISVS